LESKTFYLDTNALIELSGLSEADFRLLKTCLNESNTKLCFSHIQVDEKYNREHPNYQEKINKAKRELNKHRIDVLIEPTKGGTFGIFRLGYATYGIGKSENQRELDEIYQKLKMEIRKCMDEKGKWSVSDDEESKGRDTAKDARIGITSLDHDYFVTCDYCLHECWKKIIENPLNSRLWKKTISRFQES